MQDSPQIRPTLFEETLAAHLAARDDGHVEGATTFLGLWPDMARELEDYLELEAALEASVGAGARRRAPRQRAWKAASAREAPPAQAEPAAARLEGDASSAASRKSEREPGLAAGRVLGGCRLEQELEPGRWGRRYRAMQLFLRRPVLLEVLSRATTEEAGARARLGLELRLLARLEQAAFPQVFGVEGGEGRLWIVSAPRAGRSLEALGGAQTLSLRARLALARAACAALAHARERGVLFSELQARDLWLGPRGELSIVGGRPLPLSSGSRGAAARTDLSALAHLLWPKLAGG